MKLQEQIAKRVGDKEYKKYSLVIPPNHIQKLGWKKGQELTPTVEGNKLIIE